MTNVYCYYCERDWDIDDNLAIDKTSYYVCQICMFGRELRIEWKN